MKHCHIPSLSNHHPTLHSLVSPYGLPDEILNLRDHPHPKPNPNPKKPRDPKPGHQRDPFPIRAPHIHPPSNPRLPSLTQQDAPQQHPKDDSQKPGLNRTDWRHIHPHTLEEHLICGYQKTGAQINRLILGSETPNGDIRYTGHVPFGQHPLDALIIASQSKARDNPFSSPAFLTQQPVTWLIPTLSCIIQCSQKTETGLMLTPTYWGLKTEKNQKHAHAIATATTQ